MAKGIYVGVGGVARKVKKVYVGVNGVARKIKKIYVGVNGVARLAYSAEPGYVGAATPLSIGKDAIGVARNSNYAIFSGGNTGSAATNTADAYNASLVKSTPNATLRRDASGSRNPNYALIVGGRNYNSTRYYSTVDAYNDSLVLSRPDTLHREVLSCTNSSVGDWAIFTSGWDDPDPSSTSMSIFWSAFNSALVKHLGTDARKRSNGGGARTPNYAMFAGGTDATNVDAYNASLARNGLAVSLSVSKGALSAASVGNYAIFANNGFTEAFSDSLVRYTVTPFASNMYLPASASIEGYALFAGSINGPSTDLVYMYDATLTLSIASVPTITGRRDIAGNSVGNHVLFAGGYSTVSGTRVTTVDVIDI